VPYVGKQIVLLTSHCRYLATLCLIQSYSCCVCDYGTT